MGERGKGEEMNAATKNTCTLKEKPAMLTKSKARQPGKKTERGGECRNEPGLGTKKSGNQKRETEGEREGTKEAKGLTRLLNVCGPSFKKGKSPRSQAKHVAPRRKST